MVNENFSEAFFQVTIKNPCHDNAFTLNDVPDKTYEIIADSAGTATPETISTSTVTGSTSGCTLSYSIEIYEDNATRGSRWITITKALIDATGSPYTFITSHADLDDVTKNNFDIKTKDNSFAGKEYLMRLRVRDEYSAVAGGNVIDNFKVTFTYKCWLDELSITTEIGHQDYTFGATAKALTLPVFGQT